MAKLGFDYEVDIENTEKQGGGGGVLPRMYARIWAEALDLPATKDGKGTQAALTFEVQEPEQFKGRKFWAYWTVVHPDGFQHGAYKYGKPMFDRLARAVDVNVNADTDTDELLFKSFVAEIGIQTGGVKTAATATAPAEYYKDKNQIERFFYSDAGAKEPVPELGIIGDAAAKRPPANDNRAAPAARPAVAAAGGKKPWSK